MIENDDDNTYNNVLLYYTHVYKVYRSNLTFYNSSVSQLYVLAYDANTSVPPEMLITLW